MDQQEETSQTQSVSAAQEPSEDKLSQTTILRLKEVLESKQEELSLLQSSFTQEDAEHKAVKRALEDFVTIVLGNFSKEDISDLLKKLIGDDVVEQAVLEEEEKVEPSKDERKESDERLLEQQREMFKELSEGLKSQFDDIKAALKARDE